METDKLVLSSSPDTTPAAHLLAPLLQPLRSNVMANVLSLPQQANGTRRSEG